MALPLSDHLQDDTSSVRSLELLKLLQKAHELKNPQSILKDLTKQIFVTCAHPQIYSTSILFLLWLVISKFLLWLLCIFFVHTYVHN